MEFIYIDPTGDRTTLWYPRKKNPEARKAPGDGLFTSLSRASFGITHHTRSHTHAILAFNTTTREPKLRSRQTSRDLFTDNRTTSVSRSRVTDPKSTTKPARKPPPPVPRARAAAREAAGPGLAHLFHLDLLVVDLFEVEDLRWRFDHLTGRRRGGGRGGGGCRHDPPRRPGGRVRPPARPPPFSPEPRRPAAGRSVARDRPGPQPSPGSGSSALSVGGPRPPDFQFRFGLGTGWKAATLEEADVGGWFVTRTEREAPASGRSGRGRAWSRGPVGQVSRDFCERASAAGWYRDTWRGDAMKVRARNWRGARQKAVRLVPQEAAGKINCGFLLIFWSCVVPSPPLS